MQQNVNQASPNKKDIVSFSIYDNQGRTPKEYLPYSATTATGAYQTNAVQDQSSFYNNGAADKIEDSPNPYAVAIYEGSPLQRLVEKGAPGQDWQPGSSHTSKIINRTNLVNEVRLIDNNGGSSSYYPAELLSVTELTDENGNKSIVFKDKSGRLLLKKQQLDEALDGVHVPFVETYYVYDILGRLKYVFTPRAVSILNGNSWAVSEDLLDKWCYSYLYGEWGRVVERKVPGAAAVLLYMTSSTDQYWYKTESLEQPISGILPSTILETGR